MSEAIRYSNWEISYYQPPIPFRGFDWQFSHKDFDGAPDACDDRYGHAATLVACLDEIDDREDERFDEHGCTHGCPYGLLQMASACLKADRCVHRDDVHSREAFRATLPEQLPPAAHAPAQRLSTSDGSLEDLAVADQERVR